eukprot:TRINITY_DN46240_c0_g1_i1.p1 TRINITY_DN46240_c0_g1~~TRINITY_DN46240_c0_g1_i1.p1  ORF type:complete len:476 (+),score=50.68 TRINITY_DN46240_c0_g1_i1:65-1492(+)
MAAALQGILKKIIPTEPESPAAPDGKAYIEPELQTVVTADTELLDDSSTVYGGAAGVALRKTPNRNKILFSGSSVLVLNHNFDDEGGNSRYDEHGFKVRSQKRYPFACKGRLHELAFSDVEKRKQDKLKLEERFYPSPQKKGRKKTTANRDMNNTVLRLYRGLGSSLTFDSPLSKETFHLLLGSGIRLEQQKFVQLLNTFVFTVCKEEKTLKLRSAEHSGEILWSLEGDLSTAQQDEEKEKMISDLKEQVSSALSVTSPSYSPHARSVSSNLSTTTSPATTPPNVNISIRPRPPGGLTEEATDDQYEPVFWCSLQMYNKDVINHLTDSFNRGEVPMLGSFRVLQLHQHVSITMVGSARFQQRMRHAVKLGELDDMFDVSPWHPPRTKKKQQDETGSNHSKQHSAPPREDSFTSLPPQDNLSALGEVVDVGDVAGGIDVPPDTASDASAEGGTADEGAKTEPPTPSAAEPAAGGQE